MLSIRLRTFAAAMVLILAAPASALTVRGDRQWRGNPDCPDGWSSPDCDDTAWSPVQFPWLLAWPQDFFADRDARPLWEASGADSACVRRAFVLPQLPTAPALVHVWVDDDYELYLNGDVVGASVDGGADPPGDTYDATRFLRVGRNVLALRLHNTAYDRSALISVEIPGVPEGTPSLTDRIAGLWPWLILAALCGGFLVMAAAVRRLRVRFTPWLTGRTPLARALFAASAATVCEIALQHTTLYTSLQYHAWAAWDGGALALLAALYALVFLTAPPPPTGASDAAPRVVWPWLVGILFLALILRTYRLDGLPVGFFQDESTNALDALGLWDRGGFEVWSDSVGGRPTLFLYLLGFCLQLFGTSYLSLKVLPVALGVASVAAVYAVGRQAFGVRVGLWAAFLLAVSRWHIHYSRMAWEVNCVPVFAAAAFALLLYGLGTSRRATLTLVLAGAVLSLGLYTYAAFRAVPLAALVFLASEALSAERAVLQRRWRALLASGAVALIVLSPLGSFAWRDSERFWARYHEVSLVRYMEYFATPLPWLHQIGKGLLSLNHRGDASIRHNLPDAPHLDPIVGALFLLGLSLSPVPAQRRGMRLLWSWFLCFLALASLTRDSPHATRYLGLAPPAVLFAALAADRMYALVASAGRAGVAAIFAVGVGAAALAINAHQYFVTEANDPAADYEMNLTGRLLCEELRREVFVRVQWTPDVAFWADGQCAFLARGHFRPQEIDAAEIEEITRRGRLAGADWLVIGGEFLEQHPELVAATAPILRAHLPAVSRAAYDRSGRLLYAVYDFRATDERSG